MKTPGYDVIGDVHGHAKVLRRLLHQMGYAEDKHDVWRHPFRKVIFVGDFIDRGPHQRDALQIAKNMCDAGSALVVMGNHEFNALAWAEPDGNGGFYRPHSDKNRGQHKAFLRQLGEGSIAHKEALAWFRTLPVWLEVDGLRVVHACWSASAQTALRPFLDPSNRFTGEGLRQAVTKGTQAYAAAEILMKGPEALLPDGITFEDKGGDTRHEVRLKWWDRDATTLRLAALGMAGLEERLPELPVPTDWHYADKTPVLFGHYWMQGRPVITGEVAACVDFSVAKKGYLTAYRWSGEQVLDAENLVYLRASRFFGGEMFNFRKFYGRWN
jgi:hypothetical protein